jgi:hypothetical protein
MKIFKVDIKRMEQMLRSGMKNKDVAAFFNVTPGCISQHSKKMKGLVVRSMALEKAHEVTASHIDVVNQLQRINDSINFELSKAREAADETKGKDRLPFQRAIIDLSAEVRRQLDSQVKIFELWHDTKVIHEFHEEILNILEEVEPGLKNEIITRLKQRSAIRSTVKFT